MDPLKDTELGIGCKPKQKPEQPPIETARGLSLLLLDAARDDGFPDLCAALHLAAYLHRDGMDTEIMYRCYSIAVQMHCPSKQTREASARIARLVRDMYDAKKETDR